MAKLQGTFVSSSDSVDVEEIYQQCLYNPTSFIDDTGATRHTYEAVNGGLTAKNIADSQLTSDGNPNGPAGQFTSEVFRRVHLLAAISSGSTFLIATTRLSLRWTTIL